MARDHDPLVEIPVVPFLPLEMQPPTRTCNNCTQLKGNREYTTNWIDWECFKLPIGIHAVSGARMYGTCAEARNNPNLCGPQGNWWELYVKLEKAAPPAETVPPKEIKSGGKKFSLDL